MYVYEEFERGLWTVGFNDPAGRWHAVQDHDSESDAQRQVARLNGGATEAEATIVTLRDQFAMAAMPTILKLVNGNSRNQGGIAAQCMDRAAVQCYLIASAMMAARKVGATDAE